MRDLMDSYDWYLTLLYFPFSINAIFTNNTTQINNKVYAYKKGACAEATSANILLENSGQFSGNSTVGLCNLPPIAQ